MASKKDPRCLLHTMKMSAKNESPNLVSDAEKRRAIEGAFRKLAPRLGVDLNLVDAKISWGVVSGISAEQEHELAKAKGFQMALQSTEELLQSIRTQDELDRMVHAIGLQEEQAPTIARNTMDQIRANLLRRGGPGRTRKLDFRESTLVCKEILRLVGKKKYGITRALNEVSKMCPDLIGKPVSPRTLRDAWDRRDEYLDDEQV